MKYVIKRPLGEEHLMMLYVLNELAENGTIIKKIDELWGILDRQEFENKREMIIDLFFKWLDKFDCAEMLEFIVRAMSTKNAMPYVGPRLISFFHTIPNQFDSLKWAIGNAIWATITPDLSNSIIKIITKKEHGISRQMFVSALGKIKIENKNIIPALISILDDEDVNGHAIAALKNIGAIEAKEHIEKFLNHPNKWKRKEAQKALEKFEKVKAKEIEKERKKNIRLVHSKE